MDAKDSFPIDLGTRTLIKGTNSRLVSIPITVIRTAGLKPGDKMHISMSTDGEMHIRKDV